MEEVFLIKLNKATVPKTIKQLSDEIRRLGGKVLLITDKGYLLIVSLDSSYREVIQARSEVELISGVQIRPRQVRHIRVTSSG